MEVPHHRNRQGSGAAAAGAGAGRRAVRADGASALADELEFAAAASLQFSLFLEPAGPGASRPPGELTARRDATTLDRVHAAMLFQKSGRSEALRAIIQSEQEKGPDFLRLANALSALYPAAAPKSAPGRNAPGRAAIAPAGRCAI